MKNSYTRSVLAASLSLGLIACGGGGSGGGDQSATQANAPETGVEVSEARGLWVGNIAEGVTTSTVFGAITSSGESFFFNVDNGASYTFPTLKGSENFQGVIRAYAPEGTVFMDGSSLITLSTNGSVEANTSLTGNYTGLTSGTYSMSFWQDVYLKPVTVNDIEGSYLGVLDDGDQVNFVVSNAGELTGQSSYGCNFSGNVSTTDTTKNLFDVVVNVTGDQCLTGEYRGVAFQYEDYQGAYLELGVSNSENAVGVEALRM